MKIAVTGVSGLMGLNVAAALGEQHRVVGAYLTHAVAAPRLAAERVDVTDAAAVRGWCEAHRPDLVWHAAAMVNVDECELNPAAARRMNVDAAVNVAAGAAHVGAALLHISTDHLFDGRSAYCREDHPPSPLNVYAQSKLDAEVAVVQAHPRAVVVRTNFFGWGHAGRRSFSDWILGALRRGEGLKMFDDVYFTPILINDLVDICLDLASRGAPGVYNVAGGERLSKFAFGVALAERFGLDAAKIEARSVDTFTFAARRPHDMSLDTNKVSRAVGYPMPVIGAGFDRLARLEANGWPELLAAALVPSAVL